MDDRIKQLGPEGAIRDFVARLPPGHVVVSPGVRGAWHAMWASHDSKVSLSASCSAFGVIHVDAAFSTSEAALVAVQAALDEVYSA